MHNVSIVTVIVVYSEYNHGVPTLHEVWAPNCRYRNIVFHKPTSYAKTSVYYTVHINLGILVILDIKCFHFIIYSYICCIFHKRGHLLIHMPKHVAEIISISSKSLIKHGRGCSSKVANLTMLYKGTWICLFLVNPTAKSWILNKSLISVIHKFIWGNNCILWVLHIYVYVKNREKPTTPIKVLNPAC